MRYLLILGFNCSVYRKEPRARIYINNQLIDEFNIKHHTDTHTDKIKEFDKKNHPLQPDQWDLRNKIDFENYPPLQFYEVDIDKDEQHLNISIHIKNSDSNYNNGFISHSTTLQLRYFTFFPYNKKFLERLIKRVRKKRTSENYAWYNSNSHRNLFDLTTHCTWTFKKKIKTINNKSLSITHYDLGEDGYFECNLKKKYQMFLPELKKPYAYTLSASKTEDLLNKYEQHANQRNTD
jgi:hypothetical protein